MKTTPKTAIKVESKTISLASFYCLNVSAFDLTKLKLIMPLLCTFFCETAWILISLVGALWCVASSRLKSSWSKALTPWELRASTPRRASTSMLLVFLTADD